MNYLTLNANGEKMLFSKNKTINQQKNALNQTIYEN